MARILWWSNAIFAPTGYGNQTKVNVPRLQALGHEMAMFAFYGLRGSTLSWDGMPIYPNLFDKYGNDGVLPHARHFKADIVISLMDLAMCQPAAFRDVPWVCWFPIDNEPMRDVDREIARQAYQPIVYSRFGQRMAEQAGLDVRYIPHGVDTAIFRPLDKAAARKALGLPQDRFIVGMVGTNKGTPARKAFAEQMQAFAEFKRKHPDAYLYLHTHRGTEMDGPNLVEMYKALGLEYREDIVFCSQYREQAGLIDENEMANVYSALDVLMNASHGEGFGIPILEAQSCGTPVITGDWTAMPEITFSGVAIPKEDANRIWTKFCAWQWSVRSGAVVEALETIYNGNRNEFSEKARQGALAYDADKVAEEYWKPVLAEIEESVCSKGGKLELVRF